MNGNWRWPNLNAAAIAHLARNTPVNFLPAIGEDDTVIWKGNGSHKYTAREAWEHIRRKGKVEWWRTVWYKGYVPKCAVIHWLGKDWKLRTG